MSKRIYLDYASLTPIDRRVLREMKKYSGMEYANPLSIYKEGVVAKKAMGDARKRVGEFLHAHADEIIWTSGGTEANGLALEGVGRAAHRSGIEKPHMIISAIEHSSIMAVAHMMEKHGVEVTRLPVDAEGVIDTEELRKAIRPSTVLVSVMIVNNEIGSVQPIRDIAKSVRWARTHVTRTKYPLLHTDACQAALYLDLNVDQLGVDLLTLDGGKAYGPRGMGALYVRRGTPIEPIVYGGGQERGLRSGTENIPAIMGFAKTLDIAKAYMEKESSRISQLRSHLVGGLKEIHPDLIVNLAGRDEVGGNTSVQKYPKVDTFGRTHNPMSSAPHILNVSLPGIDNEFFVLQLDAAGVAVSTKSSCLQDEDESYVLKAIGADSKTSVRFSFGRATTRRDLDRTLKIIENLAKKSAF